MSAIFVSYRRADAQGEARLLHRDLVERFGKSAVFMDVAGIRKGRDFREEMNEQLATCRVALVVIGTEWLVSDQGGVRRVDDEQDFVRLEVATILRRADIPVIPVLVSGAVMPRAATLPEDIRNLVYRDGVELTHARWESDVATLIKAIEPYTEPANTSPEADGERRLRLVRQAVAGILVSLAGVGAFFYFSKEPPKPIASDPSATSPPSAKAASPIAVLAKQKSTPAKSSQASGDTSVKAAAIGPILIVNSTDGSLTGIELSTEKVLWHKTGRYSCVTPFDDGQALALADKGVFLIGKDGKVARSLTNIDVQLVTAVARLGDDAVVLSSASGKWVKAVDWTGRERWTSNGFHSPEAATGISVKEGTLVADGTASVKLLDQYGKFVHEIPVSRWAMSLALTQGHGLAIGVSGGVDKLGPKGKTEWTRDDLGRVSSVQALPNGELLVADPDNRRLLKLNKQGETIWEHKIETGGQCVVELQ